MTVDEFKRKKILKDLQTSLPVIEQVEEPNEEDQKSNTVEIRMET